jgi:hypothetical protein
MTSRYWDARFAYARTVTEMVPTATRAERGLGDRVAQDCPGVLRGAPKNRLAREFSREILGAANLVARKTNAGASATFSRDVAGLRWTDPRIRMLLLRLISARSTIEAFAVPDLCADAREWAATGFQALGVGTRRFTSELSAPLLFTAAEGSGTLEAVLAKRVERYESRAERAWIRRMQGEIARLRWRAAAAVKEPAWIFIRRSLGLDE